MDQNTQKLLFRAAAFNTLAKNSLLGLQAKTHSGESIEELDVAGICIALNESTEIIESLTT